MSDARRAAWAWRRYVDAVRSAPVPVVEVRYEQLVADPGAVAAQLASALDVPEGPLAEALHHAHGASVGRHARDLEGQDRADVLEEAGDLLLELGYLQSV